MNQEEKNHELIIKMTPNQLAYMIEAFHDFILERLRWTLSKDYVQWRDEIEFEVPQSVVGDVVTMYGFCLQSYRANVQIEPSKDFLTLVSFTENEWDMLNTLDAAKSWNDLPVIPDDIFTAE